jgi:hypothetical protein
MAIDEHSIMWIGTNSGLASFDGGTWTIYSTSNSDLPNNTVNTVAIDGAGIKWIGTNGGGLASFDGVNWTTFNTSNSDLPHNNVNIIVVDGNRTKWIGTDGGLINLDGENWTVYTPLNSSLPDNEVNSIVIEDNGNRWFGTSYGGVLAYLAGKIVSVEEGLASHSNNIPNQILLYQNYPNPFNPSTKIQYSIPAVETGHDPSLHVVLKVFDILGREVATLVNEEKPAGNYEVSFDASKLSSGVYFYKLQTGSNIQTKKMILLR